MKNPLEPPQIDKETKETLMIFEVPCDRCMHVFLDMYLARKSSEQLNWLMIETSERLRNALDAKRSIPVVEKIEDD